MIIVGEKLNGAIKTVAKAIQDRDADFIPGFRHMPMQANIESGFGLSMLKRTSG